MAVIFSDNFNRPDDTNLGADWQEVGADFVILNNELHLIGYSNPIQCVYTTQITPSDYAVQAFCHTGVNPKRNPGVFLRGVWNSTTLRYDCYYAAVQPDVQTVYLYRYQNGAFSTIASVVDTSIDATGSTGYTIRLEAQGSTLRVYVNGVLKITATDTAFSAGGYCGIMAGSARTSLYWDDFLVEDFGGVVYTEDLSFTQVQAAAAADLQRYKERLALVQLIVSQINDLQRYIDSLNLTQVSLSGVSDLQKFIDRPSFIQTALLAVSDLQRYIEGLSFTQIGTAAVKDLQRYVEALSTATIEIISVTDALSGKVAEYVAFIQQQIIAASDLQHYNELPSLSQVGSLSAADLQRYKDSVVFVQKSAEVIADLQRYVEKLDLISSEITQAADLQRYIERIFSASLAVVSASDLQRYIETLQVITTELITVAEKYAGVISEQLTLIQSSAVSGTDLQRYIERLRFTMAELISGTDFQRYIEQLGVGANMLVSEADLQRYIENLEVNLRSLLVSDDLQRYIEAVGLNTVSLIDVSDIYFSRTPVRPVFVILKLLKMVFEMDRRQTDFIYQGHKKNFFEYGGKPSLTPLKLTSEKYTILKSEDDAGQADSTTSTALSTKGIYEWIEAYSNGVQRSAVIFRSVGVANGLALKKAALRMYLHAIDDRFGNLHVKAVIGDNLPDFAEQDINSRLNSFIAETDIPITGLTAGQWYDFDITGFLQTVFSHADWKAGYDLCLILEPPSGATLGYLYFHSYDNSSGNIPELIIDYYETSLYPITNGLLDAYSVSDSAGACVSVVNNSELLYDIPSAANGRDAQFAVELDANVPNPVKKAELWIYVESYKNLDNFNYIYLMARKKCSNSGYTSCSDFSVASDWSDVFAGAGEYVANYLDLLKTVNPPGWLSVDITDMLNTVMSQACWGVDGRTISFLFVSSSSDAGEQVIYRASEFGNGQYAPFIKIYK